MLLQLLFVALFRNKIDNLYVVDGSFFVSSGAVNPSLTIMANAIRGGEHILNSIK